MRFGSDREFAAERGEERVVVNDKRRIDPTTGELRSNNPFATAADPADPDGAAQPLSVDTASVELEGARQEAAERLADLQRVTAEYANYRKRVDRDREQVVANAKALVLTEMLPVLDDVDRAARHGDLTGAFKTVAERLITTLTRVGLAQFGAEGDGFDPSRHEAVQFSTSPDVSEQVVGTVMRHGYTLGDRLVRAAVVGVVGPDEDAVVDGQVSAEDDLNVRGDSGGPGEIAPDGAAGTPESGTGDTTDSLGPEHAPSGVPEGEWAAGAATGDSGGTGGVGPDGLAHG